VCVTDLLILGKSYKKTNTNGQQEWLTLTGAKWVRHDTSEPSQGLERGLFSQVTGIVRL